MYKQIIPGKRLQGDMLIIFLPEQRHLITAPLKTKTFQQENARARVVARDESGVFTNWRHQRRFQYRSGRCCLTRAAA